MAENLIGQTIGRYQITAELGVGGMATVYKGHDTRNVSGGFSDIAL